MGTCFCVKNYHQTYDAKTVYNVQKYSPCLPNFFRQANVIPSGMDAYKQGTFKPPKPYAQLNPEKRLKKGKGKPFKKGKCQKMKPYDLDAIQEVQSSMEKSVNNESLDLANNQLYQDMLALQMQYQGFQKIQGNYGDYYDQDDSHLIKQYTHGYQ